MFALFDAATGQTATAQKLLSWLTTHRTPLGELPEQVAPNGKPVSVAPLAWTDALVLLTLLAENHQLPSVLSHRSTRPKIAADPGLVEDPVHYRAQKSPQGPDLPHNGGLGRAVDQVSAGWAAGLQRTYRAKIAVDYRFVMDYWDYCAENPSQNGFPPH
jgi:hypothetical protein